MQTHQANPYALVVPSSSLALRLGCAAVFPIALLMFAGCSGTSDDEPQSQGSLAPASSVAGSSPAEALASEFPGGVITCEEVEALAAPITGAFSFSAGDSSEDASGTTCVWTNAAVDAASIHLEDYATLGITVDGTTWSSDDLATLAGATDNPRAAALGGRILLGTEAATLGEAGSVQVLFPEGTVTVVATGAMLGASPDTLIPVNAVIDVAVDVAELRR
jgi:hypothetical protein